MPRKITGTSGNDILNYADAIVTGPAGHTVFMLGNGGDDVFQFSSLPATGGGGYFSAQIGDFSNGDMIDLSALTSIDASDVTITQTRNGWEVSVNDPNDAFGGLKIKVLGQGFDISDIQFAAS